MYKVAEFNNKGAQLENIIKKLEIENLSLKEDINLVKKELSMYKNTLEKTKTVLFISEADNIKIDWSSEEDVYFKEMLGEDLMHCLDIVNFKFIKYIHPDDVPLIFQKTVYFKEKKGDNFSIIFRAKKLDGTYMWLYLKASRCEKFKEETKCVCMLTEFNECFFSTEQLNELNKEFLREKHKEILNKLSNEELTIIKHIAMGKERKEIKSIMNYKGSSIVDNKLNKIYHKTGTNKISTLVFFLKDLGIL